MYRLVFPLLLLLPFAGLWGQGGDSTRWVPGLRAGLSMVPYERSVPTVASGVFVGAQLTFARPEGTSISWTADVGRVANLQINQQFNFTGLLANERVKVTEFKDFSGYTFIRVGADVQPGALRTGRLGLGVFLGVEGLVGLTGGFRRTVYSATYDLEITETTFAGEAGAGPRDGSVNEPLTAADVRRIVLTGGPQLHYSLAGGPQLSLSVLFDLTGRLVDFTDAAPRLVFLQAGFNYPLF